MLFGKKLKNFLDLWVANLIKKISIKKQQQQQQQQQHVITLAHECQIWYLENVFL